MHKLFLRTKIEIFIVVTFLILLTISSVISISRTITDTHDDIDLFIRNSKGNLWAATGDNIQDAIDDLGISAPPYHGYGGEHGYVWLPGNTTLSISSTIDVDQFVTLDMQGCEIQPTGDFDAVMMHRGSQIRNGCINTSVVSNYDSAAIMFDAPEQIGIWDTPPVITNMRLTSDGMNGKALYLHISGSDKGYISCLWAYNIFIEDFEYGIFLDRTSTQSTGNAYLNGNVFTDIVIKDCTYPIKLYSSLGAGTDVTGNMFENIKVYCNSDTEYIMWNDATATQVDHIYAIGWDNNSGTRTSYNFVESNWCYLCFRGGGDDLSFPDWVKWGESHCILNLEDSTLVIGDITEYN
jgi:hypothetical protein